MRSFIAIDLPDAARRTLAGLAEALPVGRPVAEENLHLTLAFLGEVEEGQLMGLHDRLLSVRSAPVELVLSGLDLFGGRRPSVLFVNVRHNPVLDRLQGKVVQAARAAGLVLERRRFRPHVTLSRFKPTMGPRGQARLGAFLAEHGALSLPPLTVNHFTLYRSTLRHEGALHEVLAQYRLEG